MAKRIDEYRSKYTLRKQEDLECVQDIGPKTAKLFEALFQSSCCNYDEPLKHLPPHVRHIVDENHVEFYTEPTAECLLIVHLNINGLKKKLTWLKELAQEMKPGIICVSETNNPDINNVEIQGYKMCLKPNLDESILRSCGGVAIYVRNDLSAVGIQQPKTFQREAETETAWIEVTKAQSSIVVGVIYRHPSGYKEIFQQTMNEALTKLNSLNKQVYILGDINFDFLKHSHSYIDYCEMKKQLL